MKVKDILCRDITSLTETMSIRSLIRTMTITRHYAIPIVNPENEYVGCIDVSDLIEACTPDYMKKLTSNALLPDVNKFYESLHLIQSKKIADYLDPTYPTVQPEDSLSYAANLFSKTTRRTLPVVKNKTLIGILSRLELISFGLK